MINTQKKLARATNTLSKNGGKMTPDMKKTMQTKIVPGIVNAKNNFTTWGNGTNKRKLGVIIKSDAKKVIRGVGKIARKITAPSVRVGKIRDAKMQAMDAAAKRGDFNR